jgi:hypothetical protein
VAEEFRIERRTGADSDEVVLMDAGFDLPSPNGRSTDLIRAAVPFDDEKITGPQLVAIQLAREEFNLVDDVQTEAATRNVGNSQERCPVVDRPALGLLLDTAPDLGHIPGRKTTLELPECIVDGSSLQDRQALDGQSKRSLSGVEAGEVFLDGGDDPLLLRTRRDRYGELTDPDHAESGPTHAMDLLAHRIS